MPNVHAHSPWRKSILIPFWTLQLGLELFMIGLLGLAVGVLNTWESNDEFYSSSNYDTISTAVDSDTIQKAQHVIIPIWMTMIAICLVLTITEIVLLARHKLKPLTFIIMNVIKSAIWTVIFVFDIISAVDNSSRTTSAFGIIIEAGLYLCFIIPLIYGSIIYHRSRREAKSYNPVDPLAHPTEYPSQLPQSVEYPGQYKAYGHSAVDEESAPYAPSSITGSGRPLSYQERDARFEPYRADQHRRSLSVGERPGSVPRVNVEHHDGEVYEMESSRRHLS